MGWSQRQGLDLSAEARGSAVGSEVVEVALNRPAAQGEGADVSTLTEQRQERLQATSRTDGLGVPIEASSDVSRRSGPRRRRCLAAGKDVEYRGGQCDTIRLGVGPGDQRRGGGQMRAARQPPVFNRGKGGTQHRILNRFPGLLTMEILGIKTETRPVAERGVAGGGQARGGVSDVEIGRVAVRGCSQGTGGAVMRERGKAGRRCQSGTDANQNPGAAVHQFSHQRGHPAGVIDPVQGPAVSCLQVFVDGVESGIVASRYHSDPVPCFVQRARLFHHPGIVGEVVGCDQAEGGAGQAHGALRWRCSRRASFQPAIRAIQRRRGPQAKVTRGRPQRRARAAASSLRSGASG